MSISIAHPERYDDHAWNKGVGYAPPNPKGQPSEEWECIGVHDFLVNARGEDQEGGYAIETGVRRPRFLWGHLKPEYRGGGPLLDMLASITDSLAVLRKCPPGSFPVYRSESGERSAKFSDVVDAMEGKEIEP